jgi:hypothetical protein
MFGIRGSMTNWLTREQGSTLVEVKGTFGDEECAVNAYSS